MTDVVPSTFQSLILGKTTTKRDTKVSPSCLCPERKLAKVLNRDARKGSGSVGGTPIRGRRGHVTVHVVEFLDTYLLYEVQQASVVCADLVDAMAVVAHGKPTAHSKKFLRRIRMGGRGKAV